METAEGDYKEGNVDGIKSGTSDPSGSEKLSGAVQNMVRGSGGIYFMGRSKNYQMLFRSIQGLSIKVKTCAG